MAAGPQPSLEERVRRLEEQLRELRVKLAALERLASVRADNPVDQSAVKEKVVYDWQT